MSKPYRHRQAAEPLAKIVAAILVLLFIVTGLVAGATAALVAVALPAVVVAVLAAMFGSMTVEVDEQVVRAVWAFGWPKREIALESIDHHQIVRNRWWYGLGVRWIPGGTLYAVWGLDAVEVRYRDGDRTRKFRIGTDDPFGLSAAIMNGVGPRAS